MNEMKALADELVSALPARLAEILDETTSGVWSVFVNGSYVRGDFIPGNSDLDFAVVLSPGRSGGEFPFYDASSEPGVQALQAILRELLAGRKYYGHHPNDFDVIPILLEWIPTTPKDVTLPPSPANYRYLNLFMFDLQENLQVLWGNDPRDIMPATYDFEPLVRQWFNQSQDAYHAYSSNGEASRCAFRSFVSLQVAQIAFGKRTIDKRELLHLYGTHVPYFPMKEFGLGMINEKMEQRFPSRPPCFASCEEYAAFDEQLGTLVCNHLASLGEK